MWRRRVYHLVLAGIVATTVWPGPLPAASDGEDTPLFIPVDVGSDVQPERFTVAIGDTIAFHAFSCNGPGPLSLAVTSPGTDPKPLPHRGDVTIRIQGEAGVLGQVTAIRFANFFGDQIQLDYAGLKGTLVKAEGVGKAKVEVTTHRGGTRREIRDFEITAVQRRKQELTIAPPRGQ